MLMVSVFFKEEMSIFDCFFLASGEEKLINLLYLLYRLIHAIVMGTIYIPTMISGLKVKALSLSSTGKY